MLVRRASPVTVKWLTVKNLLRFGIVKPKEVAPNLSLQMGRIFSLATQRTPGVGRRYSNVFLTMFY
jgi:hypothetical protein